MLRDYEIPLLEELLQEEKYQENTPLSTSFVRDFLNAYKKLKETSSNEDGVKSTDVMFEELGLLKQMQTPFKGWIVYGNEFNGQVTFDTNCNSVGTNMTITPELHKAIGAKMKELGWL